MTSITNTNNANLLANIAQAAPEASIQSLTDRVNAAKARLQALPPNSDLLH